MNSANRVGPRAEGTLATTPFLHLVLYLQQNRISGTLVVQHQGRETKVVFRDGRAVAARPVPRGSNLQPGLLPLCLLIDAQYSFWDGDLLDGAPGVTKGTVDPQTFVGDSLRSHTRDDVVNHIVDRYAGVPLTVASDADPRRLGLRGQDLAFFELLRRGPALTEALLEQSLLSRDHTRRLLYAFLITKSVIPVDASSGHSGVREAAVLDPSWRPPRPESGSVRQSSESPPPGSDRPASHSTSTSPGAVPAWKTLAATLRPPPATSSRPPRPASPSSVPPRSLTPPRGTPAASVAPPRLEDLDDAGKFRRVEQLVDARNFQEAARVLEGLIERHPHNAEYLGMRAWVVFNDTPGTTLSPRLVDAINEALHVDEDNVRALYTKGMALKRAGRENEAVRFFYRVVEIAPRHVDALRELRLARMRKR